MDLRISWYMGFGWMSVVIVVLSGIGINVTHAPVSWLLYIPFLIVALYMTVRFRLFTQHPWRRAHAKAMLIYGRLAEEEHNLAKQEKRAYNIKNPCQKLCAELYGDDLHAGELLNDQQRKAYYRKLVQDYPDIFLKSFATEKPQTVFAKINEDIESSELGPDILIARNIELRYSRKEAATYLQSLMLGTVR